MVEMGDFAPKQSMLLESNDDFYCWKQLPTYQVLLLERLIHVAPVMAEVQEGFQELKSELLKLGPENPKKLGEKMQIQKHPRKS